MKISINSSGEFQDQFYRAGRGDCFSYKSLKALYDYLEQLDEDYDLDVIALCCDFTESSIEDALNSYNLTTLDQIKDRTIVIEVDAETIIYGAF